MKQPIHKTMMIICEGTVTEPKYLNDLVAEVKHKAPNYVIKILPIPPKDELEAEVGQSYIRKPSKRKSLKAVENEPEHQFIPEEFRAQPLEYVWKAKEALKVDSEVWAVFDRDEHPALTAAFKLAEDSVDSKWVNIAFSSRSFEMWLLLHFELNDFPFPKTLCRKRTRLGSGKKRKNHDEYFLCGENKGHAEDCKGTKCITGYMKENALIPKKSDIKNTRFQGVFKDNVNYAINNALELRKIVGSKETVTLDKLDPYTDFDKLVFKLLHIEYDYQWFNSFDVSISKIKFNLSIESNTLTFKVENSSMITYVYIPENFCLLDIENNCIVNVGERTALEPGIAKKFVFNLDDFNNLKPAFLRIPINANTWGLFEL